MYGHFDFNILAGIIFQSNAQFLRDVSHVFTIMLVRAGIIVQNCSTVPREIVQVFIALKLQLFSYVFKIAITKLVVIRMWYGIGRNMLYSCHLSSAILDGLVFCRFWKWYWTQWLTIKKYWRTPRAFCNDSFLASAWFMLLFFRQIDVSMLLFLIRTLRYIGLYWSVIYITNGCPVQYVCSLIVILIYIR